MNNASDSEEVRSIKAWTTACKVMAEFSSMTQLVVCEDKVLKESSILVQQRPKLSVIIPAYNEEKTIDAIIQSAKRVIENLALRYEIIVVDDGSTDSTPKLIKQNKVKLLRFPRNSGKGEALKAGLQMADGDIIVLMDSDGSHLPEEIPCLLEPILNGENHVVIGSRFNGKRQRGAIRSLNAFGDILFNVSIFFLTGSYFTDTQSGFRAMKSDVAKRLNLDSKKYEVESEMLIEFIKMKCNIKEVGITCVKPFRPSYLSLLNDGVRILKMIVLKSLQGKNPHLLMEPGI